MRVSTLKGLEPRFSAPNIKNLGIQAWGDDNLYPQNISKVISSSDSGVLCLNRYIDFIAGNGFENEVFSGMDVNFFGDTADDLLQMLAYDVANYNGLAIHVNYNILGKIVSMQHVPFENCRLGELDEFGGISKIAVFPDWEGVKTYAGKKMRPTPENVDYIDIFNPEPEFVKAQIELAGGIDKYNGQILWVSAAGRHVYPAAKYDTVVSYLSCEDALGNISNRNLKYGLFSAGMLLVRKGSDTPEAGDSFSDIEEAVKRLQGDQKCQNIAVAEYEQEEDKPEFVSFRGENYDKEFTVTSQNATERIYAAFSQESFYRIRQGSVGFNSEMIADAFELYSTTTSTQRRMIERALDKIVVNWHIPISENNTAISPLKYESINKDKNEILSTNNAGIKG